MNYLYLISNFRRVVNVVFFLLGDSPASEFYMPTFRNTLFHLQRTCESAQWTWKRLPKRRDIKFRRRGITQKNEYNEVFVVIAQHDLRLQTSLSEAASRLHIKRNRNSFSKMFRLYVLVGTL
jgi:hypothetical protein